MTTELPAIGRPLGDAGYYLAPIAEALRRSPHIRRVEDVEPGAGTVWFDDADGTGFSLSVVSVEPVTYDEHPTVAYAWDAVVAAIGNHPHFVQAELPSQPLGMNLDTITALTPAGHEYTLKLTAGRRSYDRTDKDQEQPAGIDGILEAAGRLRSPGPDAVAAEATADLLEHIVATWDQQSDQTRQHASALALALTR